MKAGRMLFCVTLAVLALVFGGFVQSISAQTHAGIDDLVEPGGAELLATSFKFTEGPVWHPDGYLLFSDIIGNTIYEWTPDGKVTLFRSPSGNANGLTFDRQGRLITCEQGSRRVSRTEANGTIVTLAGKFRGKTLNSPNDVIAKSDGSIYFTDPPFGLDSFFGEHGEQELDFSGVYRMSPDGKLLDLLIDNVLPNGLAFSPDEKVLYIADDEGGSILAFDVLQDGTVVNGRNFADVFNPDGINVDAKGNLYVASSLRIEIYDNRGNHLGAIAIPEPTRNCAFGGPENKTLFVTAGPSVYRVQLKVEGVPVGH